MVGSSVFTSTTLEIVIEVLAIRPLDLYQVLRHFPANFVLKTGEELA